MPAMLSITRCSHRVCMERTVSHSKKHIHKSNNLQKCSCNRVDAQKRLPLRLNICAAASNLHPNGALDAAQKSPSSTTLSLVSNKSPQYMANLLVSCPDAKGVVASLSQFLYGMSCNIITSEQFSDLDEGQFYQRISFDYSSLLVGTGNTTVLERGIDEVAKRFDMQYSISYKAQKKKVAILVSKLDHCLYDLLIRHESGELDCDIPLVISNWPDLEPVACKFGIDFKHLPVDPKNSHSKLEQEEKIRTLIEDLDIDVIVLARYMQIFSPQFADVYWRKTLNIHHSFLPAFEGGRPYHRAHERGVKIIGATAHYATTDLDCGPIIDQSVIRISHRDSVSDMVRKGRDLERVVLSRALRWHLQDRVIVTANNAKTVVFED